MKRSLKNIFWNTALIKQRSVEDSSPSSVDGKGLRLKGKQEFLV